MKYILLGFLFGAFSWFYILKLHAKYPSIGAIFSQSLLDTKTFSLKRFKNEDKIIISGGSSVAYGIDCKKMSTTLNTPVVNFGCMVGLGPEIIFENIKSHTKDNDIIILCWEYETYLFDRKNKNLNYLAMIAGPQSRVSQNFRIYDRTLLKLYFPTNLLRFSFFRMLNKSHNLNEIYKCGWNFDDLGNVVSNSGNKVSRKELLANPLKPLLSEITIHEDLSLIMKDVNNYAKSNKIKLYSTWPNTFKHPQYFSNNMVKDNFEVIKAFWRNVGIPLVGDPYESMFTEEFFYDSCYHLNKKGVELRTEKLLTQFSKHLN